MKTMTKEKITKINQQPTKHPIEKYVFRLLADESGGFVASILEFPGCLAEGDTADEALENLRKSAESWIEVANSNGYPVRDPIDFDGFNGKIALRIPRSLHKQVAELAELEGASINQLLVMAISNYVGAKQIALKIENITKNVSNYYVHLETSTGLLPMPTIESASFKTLMYQGASQQEKAVAYIGGSYAN
jgi:predicted RNase H-like HicB family nuclease